MVKVFLSYVSEDSSFATWLAKELKARGVQVWHDKSSLRPGQRWEDEIVRGIRSGDFFIALFSSNYQSRTRSYMNEELLVAVDELRKRMYHTRWFIPVRIDECSVPELPIGLGKHLSSIQRLDFFPDAERALDHLVTTLLPHGGEPFLHHSYVYDYSVLESGSVDIKTEANLTVLLDRLGRGGTGWTEFPSNLEESVEVQRDLETFVVKPELSDITKQQNGFWWDSFYSPPLQRGDFITVRRTFSNHFEPGVFRQDSFHAFRPIERMLWNIRFEEPVRRWWTSCDFVRGFRDGHVIERHEQETHLISHVFEAPEPGGIYYMNWEW